MANTIKTYVSDGVRTSYPVDFTLGYLNDRNLVYVYQGEDPNIQLGYTWTDDFNINLDAPVPNGESFNIRRIVPRDKLVNDYVDGAQIRERNLDQSYSQALMIIEELEDGFIAVIPPWVINGDLVVKGSITAEQILNEAGEDYYALAAQAVADAQAAQAGAEVAQTGAETARGGAEAAEAAAQALYDDFNDRYYGPAASDPPNAPSGAASTAGDLYFNTTTKAMREYTGTVWQDTFGGVATDIDYANTLSGLSATNVQDAIDEAHGIVLDSGVSKANDLRGTIYETGLPQDLYGTGLVCGTVDAAVMGRGTSPNYGVLTSNIHWSDLTGSTACVQELVVAGKAYHRHASTNTTWTDWVDYYTTASTNVDADTLQATPLAFLPYGNTSLGTTRVTDMSALTRSAHVECPDTGGNVPVPGKWFWGMHTEHSDADGYGSTVGVVQDALYFRSKSAGVYSTWRRALDNTNTVHVAQTGSNAHGRYIVWSDGYMEQWMVQSRAHGDAVTFPLPLVDAGNAVILSTLRQGGHGYSCGVHNLTATGFTVYTSNSGTVAYSFYVGSF